MKKVFEIMYLVLFCFFLVFLTAAASRAQEKVTTLKYANFFPPANKVSVLAEQWCKEVEKKTNGRVKVNYFPGSALTGAAQTYDSVIKGIADIGLSFCSYTRGRFPLTEVIDLPLGYKSGYVGTKMANAYYNKLKPKEFDDVKVIYLHTSPPHRLFAKTPVNNLNDLKGLKIRATGTSAKVVQALGGVPVAMPMSDAYDALKKGVADGIVCPYEPMKGFKLGDVVSYCTPFGSAYTNVAYVVMNKNKWNSLPRETKNIIDQINAAWIEKQGKLWDELDQEGKEVFIQKGGKILSLSKEEDDRWKNLLRPILDEYVKTMKEKGLPAEKALKFCIDYLKTQQK
jgi:TRAP-type C4-dicarboxylate transport system substrate-binding protein